MNARSNLKSSSLAKSPMFRKISRALAQAKFVHDHPELKNAVQELAEAKKSAHVSESSRREFLKMLVQAGIVVSIPFPFRKSFGYQGPSVGGAPVAIIG